MFNAGGIIEDADVRVVHLIVTNEHKSWYIDVFIKVGASGSNSLAYSLESIVNLINKLLVIDVTSTYDH